ncbi:cardiolipin synthase [Thiothrix nivea]|uniref:Cardiolipin synthase n=1 Tax=Thiothrix nivea (strain ATCC 35100 / DSM 5205 / JP2) TaxID=870187 RepID=A0A656HFQ0_THINJ|nr:cardiolipin synthase [Thiothrix nivea]EIJ33845.1 cardiolipin synthetase 2 [Thiothrix nivea DSM 5205]
MLTYLSSGLNSALLLLDILIVATLLPTVVQQRRESGATLAWVLVIVLLPFIGLLGFWVFGTTRLHLRRRKRRKVEEKLAPALQRVQVGLNGERQIDGLSSSLLKLVRTLDDVGPLGGNAVEVMRDGASVFTALEQAFDAATLHIHLVYYIWEPDFTGTCLRDALVRAAQRGVEVRLLVDDVGSRQANKRFFAPLLAAGGRVERFLKVNLFSRRLNLNNRNHRKVVVIDGKLVFTGGMNVGDVYAGRGEPWQDLHARIRGPVASALQEVFCQDWYHATGEDLVSETYFPAIAETGDICAQFLASGPADERWQAIHTLLFAAMNLACQRIWIETPYFVPDRPIVMALQTAALRGVDVRLLLPGRSDHPLVLYAGRSFIDDLLAAGARVFEMDRAMPHAKAVMIDGNFATLGSANMDQRSFRLNFEGNVFFYGTEIAGRLEQDFLAICANVREVTAQQRQFLGKRQRFAESIARLVAPLL